MADVLSRLHQEAIAADTAFMRPILEELQRSGGSIAQLAEQVIREEQADYAAYYAQHADHYLCVSPELGRFLYSLARGCQARRIIEFGTSMGVSTIYLAAALRDNGGGLVIGSELQPDKAARARASIAAAGLDDLVDVRPGDALHTLRDVGGEVDLMLLDGAWSLYLPVLKTVESFLRSGAVIIAENAFADDYLAYVHDPANGYLAYTLSADEGRGNVLAVKIA